ncbi:MAG: matrixin family metalloprotease [Candidatus Solibacter sp.]
MAIWFLSACAVLQADERPGDWTGNYLPCDRHDELLKDGAMNLGVRFATANPSLAAEFSRALDFWAGILEMEWHEEDGRGCAIQVVDGYAGLFRPAEMARAQLPAAPRFQGWIAFNPGMKVPSIDLLMTAVHEVGHLLGLPHSANSSSVMYFLSLDGPAFLDSADLAALAVRHKLRKEVRSCPGPQLVTFPLQVGCRSIRVAGSASTLSPD